MLTEIRISGLGVIAEAAVGFAEGLTVVTGETGAGKTMVVTSLHLLSGARADADRVRRGAPKAVVEGRFSTDLLESATADSLDALLDSSGGERDDDGSIIAMRSVTSDGRSRAYLGGRSVPAGTLGEFTRSLLTVHGQNDQLRLQRPDQQRAALDRFAGPDVLALADQYRECRREWLAATAELLERTQRSRELAQEADRLEFALNEIDQAAPEPGEDVRIVEDVKRLSGIDELRDAALVALAALTGSDDASDAGSVGLLARARDQLAGTDDKQLQELARRADEAIAIAGDVSSEVAAFLNGLPADPKALDTLLNRQAQLRSLVRKYAADIDGVIEWAGQARDRLSHLDTSAEAIEQLQTQVSQLAAEVTRRGLRLSQARQSAAERMAQAVSAELGNLAMGRAELEVVVRRSIAGREGAATVQIDGQAVNVGADGFDDVEFALIAHSGANPLPLAKSASGGELSRVMLALELVLSESDKGTTMVFDEVDAGVGGRAAVEVGRRLARLARSHQVIVVTHLPQVAAFASTHLVVDKAADSDSVNSTVRDLDDDERVIELARMLAGLDETETGRAHAEELLAMARGAE